MPSREPDRPVPLGPVTVKLKVVIFAVELEVILRFDICELVMFPLRVKLVTGIVVVVGLGVGVAVGVVVGFAVGVGVGEIVGVGVGVASGTIFPTAAQSET